MNGGDSRSAGKAVLTLIVLICLAAAGLYLWIGVYAGGRGEGDGSSHIVEIPQGASFDQITSILAEQGFPVDDIRFKVLAYLKGYAPKIRAGEFALKSGTTPIELLEELVSAQPIQHRVTIPEGLTMKDIASLLEAEGWCRGDLFLEAARDPEFIRGLRLGNPASLEGYLYPDTYYFTRIPRLDERDIITRMTRRFLTVWERHGKDEDMARTVILASIVEKETGAAEERPLIASVFLNRLKRGMRLQSDPTVIYGIKEFSGNITRSDLRKPTPYNTYTLPGLPAGPICNPGEAALAAVLHPAESDYLYFVSKNDGTHYFSRSLKEHNRAVNRYQR